MKCNQMVEWLAAIGMATTAVFSAQSGAGPGPEATRGWDYALLPGSQLTDVCAICDRVDIPQPLRGSFRLRLLEENPLFATYAWEVIAWVAGASGGASYTVAGQGVYQIGGEVALVQQLRLELRIDDGFTNQLCILTNAPGRVERLWPMIQVRALQTNGTLTREYHLDLVAAPLREIWFSTTHGLTAGVWNWPTNAVGGGDLLSASGRVVKRNQELTARFVIMPPVPDVGLDAVDVLPGGEVAFSIESDIFSGTAGTLRAGDVLSDQGRVRAGYAQLISRFSPMPPVADQGLDALQVSDGGEVYFSVARDFFSQSLGRTIRRGDLLSSAGAIVVTNEALLARFRPADAKRDYGLDAVYVWPSGEIWFSVETSFYGEHFEPYGHGDLLSDQGYVVYRNLDLVGAFQPLEDLADFGLDALFIVTDARSWPPGPGMLRCAAPSLERATRSLVLQWEPVGRVFQVEKAEAITGPWRPCSPVLTQPPWREAGALTNAPTGFYRVRAW